ncbi:MAG TPA: ribosome small subunit-dependent GTPase A [Burkholderiaceae bacterium]
MNSSCPHDALIGIGLTAAMSQRLTARPAYEGESPMRVIELRRDAVCLHDGQRELLATLPPALVQSLSDDAIAVGDWVLAEQAAPGRWRVVERIPPLTQIARRTNDGRGAAKRQVLVANVDTALLVMGLDRDFNARRLERYLALCHLAAVPAVLVLTKADTLDAAALQRRADEARAALGAGTPLLSLDARAPQSAALLAPWLTRGQTAVMLGSSGAGKSTLTNTLCGEAVQDTGGVRIDDGRGRHTTTTRTLRRTLAGGCVIDTPGLRALRLDIDDASQLAGVFDDVGTLAMQCRFRDCRHQSEPGCAVREGLPAERVRNFHKLQREARRDSMNALEMREQRRDWKLRGREGTMRARAKRG